jgi:hypothetical protein
MLERLRETWLPRLLFVLTTGAAIALLAAVPLAPCLDDEKAPAVVRLFARDPVVRRTALASGLGLLVTAVVFFRAGPAEGAKPQKEPPPDRVVGA